MFRLYDWVCVDCNTSNERLIETKQGDDIPKYANMLCLECGKQSKMYRRLPLVAQYMGEKPFAPVIHGGKFDTAGNKPTPPLPEFTGERFSDFKDYVNTKEYQENKTERKRIKKENAAKKRRLAALRRGENVNFRRDRLPGDPKNIDK